MTELAARFGVEQELDTAALTDFLRRQRWFGAKSREIAGVTMLDAVVVAPDPLTAVALAEVRFDGGTHEVYQLVLAQSAERESDGDHVFAHDGEGVREASNDARLAEVLVTNTRDGASIASEHGALEFQAIRPIDDEGLQSSRVLGGEQSNTSIVLDGLMLKLYRRVEAGISPELEMLLFLTEHAFTNVPELVGWYRYAGTPITSTLGVLQRLLPDARDGWDLVLEAVPGDGADAVIGRVRRLGEVVGTMHCVLASEPHDPGFAPEEATPEAAALLATRVDEQVEVTFADLPDDESLAPIRGRAEDARTLVRALGPFTSPGRAIRTHGDLHLGQALWSEGDWWIIDFEGEPARPVAERRTKALPLRDVAGMLRSFSYAVSALEVRGTPAPEGWEARARAEFLDGYRDGVDAGGIIPPDDDSQQRFLGLFELEKALYELRYDLEHRPEWAAVPARAIARLLDEGTP